MRGLGRIALGLGLVGAALTAVVLMVLGRLPLTMAIDALVVSVASLSVLGLVKLPWDLWFAARVLVAEQTESVQRGIAIDERAQTEAKRIASRALLVAITLHVLAAAAAFGASAINGDGRGLVLAFAYLASMGLRPIQAGWIHVRGRIAALRAQALVPREDAVSLLHEVRHRRVEDEARGLRIDRLEAQLEKDSLTARQNEARLEARLDRVLVELERSAERLTEDRELVQGLRALARMLRSPTAA